MAPIKPMLRPGYGIGPGNVDVQKFIMPSAYQVPNTGTATPVGPLPTAQGVKDGAIMACSLGTAPAGLHVIPPNRAAVITDAIPVSNISPFGMCISMANPAVAAATAAAMGVLTPQPCIPATNIWIGGSPTNLINGQPALTPNSKCLCAWGGSISINWPGQ